MSLHMFGTLSSSRIVCAAYSFDQYLADADKQYVGSVRRSA